MTRTTLLLDTALYTELKKRAAAEGRTLTDVVERLLRLGLAARPPGRRVRISLPSYDLGPFLARPSEREAWGRVGRGEGGRRDRRARRDV